MNLDQFLILDCQTTAMRPSAGQILEIAWAHGDSPVHSRLIKLPEGKSIPARICEITGLSDRDFGAAIDEATMLQELQRVLAGLGENPRVVIHYAQFEKAFLLDLYSRHTQVELNFEILCSQRIAKKLFPELPSQNLRGIAGFLGLPLGELKRAASHVSATVVVWKSIVARLNEMGIRDLSTLQAWFQEKPKSKTRKVTPYQYRMDREKRLALPEGPGIYRMLSKAGEILYVGKATSLRSRVNSYFRGQKGRDRRKLELMAQVWDLRVTECATTLEAELLESDEIKRWNPPYNVSLRNDRRPLVFFSRDFEEYSDQQDDFFYYGPFRPSGILESLQALKTWLQGGELGNIFYQEIDDPVIREGFTIFCKKFAYQPEMFDAVTMRMLLTMGMRHLRQFRKDYPNEDLEIILNRQKQNKEEKEVVDAGDVAEKLERLFLRSAATLLRARQMTKLLNADVAIGTRWLRFRGGHASDTNLGGADFRLPWQGADLAMYDRMSILLSRVVRESLTVIRPSESEPG